MADSSESKSPGSERGPAILSPASPTSRASEDSSTPLAGGSSPLAGGSTPLADGADDGTSTSLADPSEGGEKARIERDPETDPGQLAAYMQNFRDKWNPYLALNLLFGNYEVNTDKVWTSMVEERIVKGESMLHRYASSVCSHQRLLLSKLSE